MRFVQRFKLTVLTALILSVGFSSNAGAAVVLTNGSFETGDYSGWTLLEGEGSMPTDGTWGIVQNGQVVNPGDSVFDFFDQISVAQRSGGLPITYQATEGNFLAIQLQNGSQDHRLLQDVQLPENVATLNWDMFFTNHARSFSASQYLAVHVRNLNDDILETLYVTAEGSPLAVPMSNFSFDISSHAGEAVRIDVDMKVRSGFLDAGFDNFVVGLAAEGEEASTLAPPGWSKSNGKKLGWAERRPLEEPRGFQQGKKTGWAK
jgi:hypothetical protein